MLGLLGIVVFMALAWAMCDAKKSINWRTVGLAFVIQIGIGAIVFGVPAGRAALDWLSTRVSDAIGAGKTGVDFLFGPLTADGGKVGFVFALQVLPMIVFFSSLIAVLYHLGVMQKVIRLLGGGLRKLLGTSSAESMSAAANIFVGQTEAPLVVKPYIAKMTSSELFAVMVGGLASVAGSVLAGYAAMGVEMKYLLAASFMAAPGGLALREADEAGNRRAAEGELAFAEGDDKPVERARTPPRWERAPASVSHSMWGPCCSHSSASSPCSTSCWEASGFQALDPNREWYQIPDLSLQWILGWLFSPIAWLAGIPYRRICWREAA
jgi:concentrative nucleoside transporter, CNT family